MVTRIDVSRYSAPLALLLLAAVAGACSNSSPSSPSPAPGGGGGGAPTFQQVSSQILTPACTSCHTDDGRSPAGGLNLKAAAAWANLVNAASSEKAGAVRVIPGDADNSYLVQKLIGAAGIVGLRMPRNGPPYLTDAQVQFVKDWINAGALNN